jgi:hypothetical protein
MRISRLQSLDPGWSPGPVTDSDHHSSARQISGSVGSGRRTLAKTILAEGPNPKLGHQRPITMSVECQAESSYNFRADLGLAVQTYPRKPG